MKLHNMLAVATLGALLATGCTVTDASSDGGTEGGTDTGTAVVDTGAAVDSATDTPAETATDPSCAACRTAKCATEGTACAGDTTCVKEFNDALTCLIGCGTDKTCMNKTCIEPMGAAGKSVKANDLMTCLAVCLDLPEKLTKSPWDCVKL